MLWQHRKLAADDLARDFSVTAQSFADSFIQYVAAVQVGEAAATVEVRTLEACALIWASIEATFNASALNATERDKVAPRVRDALGASWRKYGNGDAGFIERVIARAADYLRLQDQVSQLKTATKMMLELMASIDADAAKLLPSRTLTAMLAHRMLADLRRLNEVKSGHSID